MYKTLFRQIVRRTRFRIATLLTLIASFACLFAFLSYRNVRRELQVDLGLTDLPIEMIDYTSRNAYHAGGPRLEVATFLVQDRSAYRLITAVRWVESAGGHWRIFGGFGGLHKHPQIPIREGKLFTWYFDASYLGRPTKKQIVEFVQFSNENLNIYF